MTDRQYSVDPPSFRKLVRIGFPMIVSQASETVNLFVDRLFLSWLGKEHLAAAMSGGLSSFVFGSFFAGIVGYVNAIVAQFYGSRRYGACVQTIGQGFWLSLFFYPLALGLIPLVLHSFTLAGHSPVQIALESRYFTILMYGSVFLFLRNVFVGFFLGIGKTGVVMLANILGMAINIPLNYVLVFGAFGIPAMGMEGAALGTLGGSLTITLFLGIAYLKHQMYQDHRSSGVWRIRVKLMKKLLRFGVPAGAELFINVFAFNVFLQLMHSYGTDVAAAVTITFNYDMVAFIPMVGLGIATTAMVGQHVGAGDPEGAKKSIFLSLKTGYVYAGIMSLLFVFGAPALVSTFTGGMAGEDAGVRALAEVMIRLAALYTLADITQLVFSGGLRGAGDTRWVMVLSGVLHWIMAGIALLMIRVFRADPVHVWLMFIGFVLTMGIAMFLRYRSGRWKDIPLVEDDHEIDSLAEVE